MLSWLESICLNLKLQNLRSEQDCNKIWDRNKIATKASDAEISSYLRKKLRSASNFNTFDIYHLPLKTPMHKMSNPDPCNNMSSLRAWFWRFIIGQCTQFWQTHRSMNFTPLLDKHKQNFREKNMIEGYDDARRSCKQQTDLHIVHDN